MREGWTIERDSGEGTTDGSSRRGVQSFQPRRLIEDFVGQKGGKERKCHLSVEFTPEGISAYRWLASAFLCRRLSPSEVT